MASLLATAVLLASLTSAIPYPPEVAIPPTTPTVKPDFGHKSGNLMKGKSGFTTESVLATGGYVTGGAAVTTINNQDGIGAGSDSYTMYWGDGSDTAGWPHKEDWVSFEDMFNNNKDIMFNSCGWSYNQANDDGPEVGAIYDSIQQVATETAVDHRFILAVIMQESGGCVRVSVNQLVTELEPKADYTIKIPTSFSDGNQPDSVRNPGLMQDHDGDGTCNSDITGQVQDPCPTGVITQMIREGTAGTNSGDGLAQTINGKHFLHFQATAEFGVTKSRAFYLAARIYNSGSVDPSGNLEAGYATHCYASDIANRLTGWVLATKQCYLDPN
ncbi:glycoside hydrolase protein [Rutstroemia sp. NJR-2017a WRK4]|nr:glycoside hydrolase protein [Rutstroemia sp. NJR-2017a WRK4]PQE11716.1 glycoside hydrolase protein [Rutstroemia sp. NJR-2017a WRK4]